MKPNKTNLILFLIIIIYLIFISLSINQLYYGDEVAFIEAAREIASGQVTGHFSHFQGKLIEDRSNMLMHPPTYIYLLAFSIFLFGENPLSIRLISILFTLGVIILVYLITRKILREKGFEKAELWALIAAFLYAINPLTIQSSILVDIDGGLLNFSIMLFFYLYISRKALIYLVPSLFLVFASKLIGPVMLFAFLFLLSLGTKNYKELFRVIKLFIISGILFFLSFFIYATIFELNPNRLFSHNSIIGAITSFIGNTYLTAARSLWGFKTFFYFATPFLIFLFIIISFKILINTIKYKIDYLNENKDIILLWLFSIIIILFLMSLPGNAGWNFPKYYSITIPSIIILIVYFTPKNIVNFKKAIPIIVITSILLLSYFIIFLKDPIIPEIEGRIKTLQVSQVIKPVLTRIFLYAIVPIFLCIGLFKRIPKKKLYLVLFFLLVFTSVYINIIQAKADYSTHNLYGDKGLREVIEFMKDKQPSQILCYVHLCYFLNYTDSYELTSLYYDKPKLIETLNKGINWIVLYQKDIDLIGEEILKDFRPEKEIGSYKVLKRKDIK